MRCRTIALRLRIPAVAEFQAMRAAMAWLAAMVLATLPYAARADDDLPGRVGRIAEFAGQLYLSPQERPTEWSAIGINYPVTTGDNLWVSGDGQVEIDYGGGQLRLAGDTNLHVSRLDDSQLALFVAQGRLIIRVRVLDPGDAARIDTPSTQVALTRPGLYRIDVAPGGHATTASVREGEALIALTAGVQQALPGQSVTVSGPAPAIADIRNSFGVDGFDVWSADRDRRYERGGTATYVSRQMVGYAELDDWGTWENDPTYGPVWYPQVVAPDWTPYRDGYWTNVGGWGLTWVDAAPWGFAPSHYGRWARIGGRWGWCPGAFVARPIWAPALVAWYGGAGWGLSVGGGGPAYGWVPLGWGDPYLPWWRRCSHNCWAQYNRPFAVNVNQRPTAPPGQVLQFRRAGRNDGRSWGDAWQSPARPREHRAGSGGAGTVGTRARQRASLLRRGRCTHRPIDPASAARPRPPPCLTRARPRDTTSQFPDRGRVERQRRARGPARRRRPRAAAHRVLPRSQPRRPAPPALTPDTGGTVVAVPPARGEPRGQPQQPRPTVPAGQAVAPPDQPQPVQGRAAGPGGGSGAAGSPPAVASPGAISPGGVSPGAAGRQAGVPPAVKAPPAAPAAPAAPATGGLALPPPRPAPSVAPAPAQPPTGRAAPPPVAAPPGPAPQPVPAAVPQDRPQAKGPDAKAGAAGKPVERETPAPAPAAK